ncbi:MAG: hypothetical protein K0B52_04265, partial [FCB group bacterium]|nr:hypothetical protein [FCB group bacterium]
MRKRNMLKCLTMLMIASGALYAANDIRSYRDGFVYTDSMRSKIYIYSSEKGSETLVSAPGVGYYYTLSPDHHLLGFKWREARGGLESPAYINLNTKEIYILHEAVYSAGQVSFSDAGDIAYTIGNTLYVERDGQRAFYDLGTYANLAPISPDGRQVVYNDAEDQLWIMDLDGRGSKHRITDDAYGHIFPNWSPDGRYIAFARLDGILFIYDTEESRTITVGRGADLRWSVSGDSYAFVRVELDEQEAIRNTEIMVADLAGNILFATDDPTDMQTAPCFLPDGTL